MIIIDTDVLIEISDKRSKKGEQVYQEIISSGDDVAITAITLYETMYGLMELAKPAEHLSSFRVFDFTKEDAQRSAKIEVALEKKGKRIKRTDIMIASTAISQNAALCTFDRDFLELEDLGLRLFK